MRNLIYKIQRFLGTYALVFCWVCHGLFFSKDIEYEVNTIGQTVPLCEECHKMLFRPFSEGK